MRLANYVSVVIAAMSATSAFAASESKYVDSRAVREVQQVLNHRGIRTRIDGIMGPRTENAVRTFQRTHNLEPTGELNRQTLVALGIQRSESGEPQYAAALVRTVQETLANRGYKPGAVDGTMSDATQTAVRAFQKSENLQPTGDLNTQTLAALGIPPESASAAAENAVMSDATVRDVQRRLNSRGYRAGRPDGVIGNSTRSALMAFQRSENLQATGNLNRETISALGLTEPSASVGSSR